MIAGGVQERPCLAFTLIELLLVMIIMAVLAGFSVPLFSKSYAERQVRQAADDIVYLMRYARVRAMTEQVVYQVALKDGAAVLLKASDEVTPQGPLFKNVSGAMGRLRALPAGVMLLAAPLAVNCFPDGKIDPVHFSVRGRAGGLVISTEEVLGHVAVWDDENDT